MTEEPQQPEGDAPEETPEDEPNQGAPGEGTPEAPGEDAPAQEAPGEEAPAGEAPAAEAPAEEPAAAEAPAEEAAAAEAPDETAPEETPEEGPPKEGAPGEPGEGTPSEAAPEAGEAADQAPAAGDQAAARPRGRSGGKQGGDGDEVIPGAHLEPDLVLEEQRAEGGEFDQYAQYGDSDAESPAGEGEAAEDAGESATVAHTPLELAADARYNATGKRKSAIARVILKPGEGTYTVNGRHLDEYFPRVRLQRMASQPLEAAGYHTRMDVVARIHGGGVSAQANALRHGIARALVEADPALRTELKRRGYLTRDPREKERKKAGLKKARKRPQFSKR